MRIVKKHYYYLAGSSHSLYSVFNIYPDLNVSYIVRFVRENTKEAISLVIEHRGMNKILL